MAYYFCDVVSLRNDAQGSIPESGKRAAPWLFARRTAFAGDASMTDETGRIEAFSDGVFAVAITLLVLDIKVPPASPATVPLDILLARQWPSYLAFATSFATILIMWVNHHRVFTHIYRSSDALLFLNGLLLFGVTIVPFSTALVSEHLGHPGQHTAAIVYNGVYIFNAIFFNLLWRSASRNERLLRQDVDRHAAQSITSSFRWGVPAYCAALALAFVNLTASLILNFMMAMFFALPKRTRRAAKRAGLMRTPGAAIEPKERDALTNSPPRDLLRHTLATLAYRAAKTLRDAPAEFAGFRASPTSRTAAEILAHMGDLMDWALSVAEGNEKWRDSKPLSWVEEQARFFRAMRALDARLAAPEPLGATGEKLFQGPIADALTHTGQLAYLRRLAGCPVRGENYLRAQIKAGMVGEEQTSPVREF